VPELIASIPLALLIVLACHEAGRILLRLFRLEELFDDPLDSSLARLAVGFTAIGFVLALLGLTSLLRTPVLWILLIALIASSFAFGRKPLVETASSLARMWRESRTLPLNNLLAIAAVLALAMDFVLTCVPTTAWDALTYHYPLPAIWLRAGGFIPRPDICYSELPCGSEMIFAFAFGLGGLRPDNMGIGHLAANHLTWLAGLFACVSLVSITRRLGPAHSVESKGQVWNNWTPGLLAAIAFLSLPIIYVEEMEGGYIENFIVFLSLTILIALLRFRESKNPRLLPLIGILAGGLLASKHTNLFLDALVLGVIVVWIIGAKDRKTLWATLAQGILLAIVIPLPWYLKSYIHTGDPAWPFVSRIVNPHAPLPDIMYWSNPNVQRSILGFLGYIPRLSWDVSLVQFDFRLLSWYFLPLLPFTIWWCFRKGNGRTIGLVTWVLILLIYLLAPGEPRYMLVAWVLYAAIGAWGLFSLAGRLPWIPRLILPLLLMLPIGWSVVDRSREVNHRVPTILGLATVDAYFEKSLDIWPLIKFINEETDPSEAVVLVEPRIFYVQRPFIIWYPFPTPPTADWNDTGIESLLTQWQNEGVRYVLVTYGPNYRAMSLVNASAPYRAGRQNPDSVFSGLPAWVEKLASYTERGTSLDWNGHLQMDPRELFSRLGEYDVSSMFVLSELERNGYIRPEFPDERSGVVYELMLPGEDISTGGTE